jgi:tetratricopeptide (TPR) repeat protein
MHRCLGCILLIAGCGWAQPGDGAIQRALADHQAGNWTAAEAGYRDFLKRNPEVFEIRSNLGAVLARQGKYEEAIEQYSIALKRAPDNPGILLNLALAHYKAGQIPEAVPHLEKVRKLSPNHLQAALLLADCWLQMDDNAKVVQVLRPLASAHPDDMAVTYALGTALVRGKQIDEGQKLLDRILRKGDSAEARLLLGTAKFGMADFAGARTDFQAAVYLNSKLPAANGYLGRALMATGDTAGAVNAFRAELELNPNDFESNLSLAVILKQDQELSAARTHLQRALRVRPGDIRVRYQQATIDLAEGKTEHARQSLESIVQEAPEFVEAHVTLATAYYRLKRKADGDRERAVVEKLNAELQARQPRPVGGSPK